MHCEIVMNKALFLVENYIDYVRFVDRMMDFVIVKSQTSEA